MTEEQETLLGHYTDLQTELNAVNALREDLERRARDIHAKQRQLANKMAALSAPDGATRAESPGGR